MMIEKRGPLGLQSKADTGLMHKNISHAIDGILNISSNNQGLHYLGQLLS